MGVSRMLRARPTTLAPRCQSDIAMRWHASRGSSDGTTTVKALTIVVLAVTCAVLPAAASVLFLSCCCIETVRSRNRSSTKNKTSTLARKRVAVFSSLPNKTQPDVTPQWVFLGCSARVPPHSRRAVRVISRCVGTHRAVRAMVRRRSKR